MGSGEGRVERDQWKDQRRKNSSKKSRKLVSARKNIKKSSRRVSSMYCRSGLRGREGLSETADAHRECSIFDLCVYLSRPG